MTTKLELAEILRISEETGRGIQERYKSTECEWYNYDGSAFTLRICEYRLAPKIVRHERWFVVPVDGNIGCTSKEDADAFASSLGDKWKSAKVEWETEE